MASQIGRLGRPAARLQIGGAAHSMRREGASLRATSLLSVNVPMRIATSKDSATRST